MCLRSSLVWKSKFNSICEGMDPGLMDLVGYTNGEISPSADCLRILSLSSVSAHSHGHGSKNRYYWKPDLFAMQKRLKGLENGDDGVNTVREFRERKKAEVDEVMKVRSVFIHTDQ